MDLVNLIKLEIICVVTDNSNNPKTGSELLQTWILDANVSPIQNNRLALIQVYVKCQHKEQASLSKRRQKVFAAYRSCYVNLLFLQTTYLNVLRGGKYKYLNNEDSKPGKK